MFSRFFFYHVLGRFSVRGVKKHHQKSKKTDPGPFLASDLPTHPQPLVAVAGAGGWGSGSGQRARHPNWSFWEGIFRGLGGLFHTLNQPISPTKRPNAKRKSKTKAFFENKSTRFWAFLGKGVSRFLKPPLPRNAQKRTKRSHQKKR
jgi:hypothetical protein